MNHARLLVLGAAAALFLVLGSCATPQRPVLYPNAFLQNVGEEQAQADIDACMEFAATQVEEFQRTGKIGGRAVEGAVAGGVGGAAVGAVTSGNVGRSAGAGAAAGLAVGAVRGIWDSKEPDPLFKQFVNECLREKGYSPQAWR